MKKLLEQYWKEANQHKELDPLNFEIEDFTERFMYKHRNALRLFNVVGQSEREKQLKTLSKQAQDLNMGYD